MSQSVIIIACGIAGSVLAMLLKHKGFSPIIYERHAEIQQAGISLGLSPQTFKVLNILGLAEKLITLGVPLDEFVTWSELRGEIIGRKDAPANALKWLGWPQITISRSTYARFLYDSAVERSVEMHFSKKLVDVKQDGDKVHAVFEDGTEAQGDLLVGCDGLHSAVRNVLFGKEEVKYSGLIQVGGFAPIPDAFKSAKSIFYQVFGEGAHFLASRVSDTQVAWATTIPQPTETQEDWRRMSLAETKEMVKHLQVSTWNHGPSELVNSATFVTRYGLYERPILPVWHKGRVVLVGDAAHPTGPHMGQGSNQAMEDCYHIVRLLCKAESWTNTTLEAAFTEYERIRIPIVTKSVGQAKIQGAHRVLIGRDACEKSDEMLKQGGGYDPESMKVQLELVQGPFTGESEI
ncbi:FAD/NADP-binding domain-containing protein [Dacryopinax primogenitus]|uniref:FAD/NADP-binding domain-containing protein n=1 Tax=Dacryopinax primogenitus (strain DJM 731) TaxID=1858805 RepID=M5GAB8_DACPD|nr:FAD/NADP-binding domain-containing protein [Dacryopinax primogenitus]EJU02892.1 FAD/NADP-binding domain-containing protein [Dacryopinax primogenitus]